MNTEQLATKRFWRGASAEALATLLFVFFNCGNAVAATTNYSTQNATLQIALCFGLTITVLAHGIGHVSGGHINPAVTFGLMITQKCDPIKGIIYIIMQCIGAILGSAILKGILPDPMDDGLGANGLATNVTAGKGFGLEVIMTFLLMFTVMAMIDPGRVSNGFAPLAIGLSIFIAHLIGIPFTGCGINPARSLGPAVVASKWDDHWVFWVGPLVGAGIAAPLYEFWFAEERSQGDLTEILATSPKHSASSSAAVVHPEPTPGVLASESTDVQPFDGD